MPSVKSSMMRHRAPVWRNSSERHQTADPNVSATVNARAIWRALIENAETRAPDRAALYPTVTLSIMSRLVHVVSVTRATRSFSARSCPVSLQPILRYLAL